MDFGVVLQTDPPAAKVIELAQRAEALGFSHAWTFDSHVLWQEPYVIYSQILSQTQRLIVGPMVTNPGTRDWTLTASLFATLNDMFGERTICGIGRGDSALRVVGRSPCSLDEVAAAIRVIKELAAGRAVTYREQTLQLPWRKPGKLDVWMAAYGPKALAVCGRCADGFILQLADPNIAAWTIASVRDAAAKAGRHPDELRICVAAPAMVGNDLPHQRDQVRWFGGMVGNHVADLVRRYGADGSRVPAALTDYIAERQGYDYAEHGRADNPHTAFVPDAIVDRFCILGSPENHLRRLRELQRLGVDQFALYLMHDQQQETLQAYGDTILPALGKRASRSGGVR